MDSYCYLIRYVNIKRATTTYGDRLSNYCATLPCAKYMEILHMILQEHSGYRWMEIGMEYVFSYQE